MLTAAEMMSACNVARLISHRTTSQPAIPSEYPQAMSDVESMAESGQRLYHQDVDAKFERNP